MLADQTLKKKKKKKKSTRKIHAVMYVACLEQQSVTH